MEAAIVPTKLLLVL